MKPNWKECVSDPRTAQWSGLYVTMNRKGHIVMTKHTYHRLFEPKAFVLLFDAVNNRIGLKPAALSMLNAYKVGPHGKYGGKVIFAYRLTQEFGIDIRETIEFQDPEIDYDGILVLDLRTARVSSRIWTKQRHEEWKKTHGAASKPRAASGEREISSQLPVVSSQTETSSQMPAVNAQQQTSGQTAEARNQNSEVRIQPEAFSSELPDPGDQLLAISTMPEETIEQMGSSSRSPAVSIRPERAIAPTAIADEDDDGSCDCFQCLSGNATECLEIAVAGF